MNLPETKRLYVNFMVKLLLILAIIIGGVALVIYNKENTSYFEQKRKRVTDLVFLDNVLQKTSYSYLNFIGGDSAQLDSLKWHLSELTAQKKVLKEFTGKNEAFAAEAKAVTASLNREEHFYISQLSRFTNGGEVNFLTSFSKQIGATHLLLHELLILEREEITSKIVHNEDFYEVFGYMILGIAALIMLMNVVLYIRSVKSLKKQLVQEKEMQKARQVAQSANNAKSEYLAMISHEIRTPMNGVLGMSNLLLQGSLTDEQKDYTQTIHNSAESLLRIVNDVLDFSKIEAGKIHLDKSSVNIRDLIMEAFSILPKSTDQLRINHFVDANVPKFIYCDPIRLKQVLLNFLSNAIKFTERGNVTLECKVIDKDENDFIRLGFVVKDTGIGIAKDRIKLLFKPFVQVDHTTVRKYGGTGLGLNIAYNLVSMMGGKINVNSQVGVGSNFVFFIQTKEMVESKKVEKVQETTTTKILDKELSGNFPLRILVVDDNEINLMLITKTLDKLGYQSKRASNGQLALDLIKQEEFDLIFMDMQMPIMDGTVATTEIRKLYKIYEYPVVIALTANALGDGKDKCLEAGMQDFIAKPFKPAEIEEVIKKWAPKIVGYKSKHQSISLS